MKFFSCAIGAAGFGLLLPAVTLAQNTPAYPVKTVRIVVPVAPGGGTDPQARLLARKFQESMGQSFVVENRTGAASMIGTEYVVKSPPDGYTLLCAASTLAGAYTLSKNLSFDLLKDLAPVGQISSAAQYLVVHASVPVSSVKEFIALAKTSGRKFNYASAGTGGGNHLSQELFKTMAGIEIAHVPYKGAAEQTTALISGEVQMSFIQVQVVLPQVRAGRLKGLAITSAQRLAIAPDLPTIAEAAVPGYEATSWQGVVVPAGTPRAIVDRLHVEISKALQATDVKDRMTAEGSTAGGIAPAAFAAFIKSETVKWANVVKLSGAKAE